VGFSRQEYWNELPCPPPGDLPDPGIEPVSLRSPALADRFFTTSATWETYLRTISFLKSLVWASYGELVAKSSKLENSIFHGKDEPQTLLFCPKLKAPNFNWLLSNG